MEQLRVGVIGLGRMGQQHCRVYSGLRRAQLVGVCDSLPAAGQEMTRRYDVPFYAKVGDLLDRVDAVSVVTPTSSHYEIAMECVGRGTHMLLEKPFAQTVEQGEALLQAIQGSPTIVQVGHIERFNPAYTELKNVLEDRAILAIAMRRLSAYGGSNRDVDVIFDLMIHDIDLALDLTGRDPTSVSAFGISAHDGAVDHAVVYLGFDSGPLVTLTASRVTEEKIRSIEVTALDAYMEADLLNKSISVQRRTTAEYQAANQRGIKYHQESIVENIHVPSNEPLFSELQHFVDCVLDDKPSLVPAGDGLRALRLATAIRSAAHERLLGVTRYRRPQPGDLRPVMLPIQLGQDLR
jgi:predicted dehydrogenase